MKNYLHRSAATLSLFVLGAFACSCSALGDTRAERLDAVSSSIALGFATAQAALEPGPDGEPRSSGDPWKLAGQVGISGIGALAIAKWRRDLQLQAPPS